MYAWSVLNCSYRYSIDLFVSIGFLRKVYGILSAQLIFTTVVAAFFMLCEPVAEYMKTRSNKHPIIFIDENKFL